MAEGLKIQIGADVGQAVAGLKQVETAATKTASVVQKMAPSVGKATAALQGLPRTSSEATQSLVNLSRVAQDAPYGFIGIANNLNPLLESFQRLKVSTGSTGGALKALGSSLTGAGGLGLAIGVVSSLMVVFGDRLFGAGQKAKEAKSAADALRDSINGIFQESAKEAANTAGFIAILKSETETRERKLSAIKELQKIQPEIFANLKLEGNAVIGLDAAYKNYLENLKTVIAVKIKQAQLEQKITDLLKKQGVTQTQSERELSQMTERFTQSLVDRAKKQGGAEGQSYVDFIAGKKEKRKKDEQVLKDDIDSLIKDITELSKGIKVSEVKIKPDKVEIDDQFLPIFKLDKPIPIEASIDIKRIEKVMFGTDLLEKAGFSDRIKALEKVIVAPDIKINPAFTKAIKEQNERLQETLKLAEYVGSAIADAFTQAFDAISKGKNVFQALGEAIKGVVLDLIKAAIRAFLLSVIMNIILPGSSKAAGGFGQLIGLSGTRATGGPVGAGKAYLVGEKGPEIFQPSVSGSIIPNNRAGSFMGGLSGMFSQSDKQYVRGNNLVLVTARTNRSQSRLG